MNEVHVIGPPGCGKTSWGAKQIKRAVEKYGPHRVLACSFTRAAVRELNTKNLPIPEDHLGTLHALAYRGLDRPEIAEQGKYLKDFSAEYSEYAMVSGTQDSVDDGYSNGCGSEGEKLLRDYSRLRATLRPRDVWPTSVLAFAKHWEQYKQDNGLMDFTDLIDNAIKEGVNPPGLPDVGFFDEAQDFTPLELALVRKWSEKMGKTVFIYDPDQAIYHFKGSDPEKLINKNLPPENLITLKQSHRVPQAVQAIAEEWINQIPLEYRYERKYLPRAEVGEAGRVSGTFSQPEGLVERALRRVQEGKDVLLLASCGYMLDPILKHLRAEGIPYSNPYRKRRRDWNPLAKVTNQKTAAERVQAFQAAFFRPEKLWTLPEIELWIELTKGITKRKWKNYAQCLDREKLLPVVDLLGIMEVEEIVRAREKGLYWLQENLAAIWKSAEFPIKVGMKDELALHEEPLLHLGTIHSLKGGEADVVYLCPDLSPQAEAEWTNEGTEGARNIRRLFYVGMTRARESLFLCEPSGKRFVEWL